MKKDLLIVVDYQNDFISSEGKVAQKLGKEVLEKSQLIATTIQTLIDKWHKKDHPVLFIKTDYNSENYVGIHKIHRSKSPYGDTALKDTWGHELYQLKPGDNDDEIVKNFYDGFYKTNLEDYLKKKNIENIYFCGINTDVCVFHTAIGCAIRGYTVYVIEDATETVTQNKEIFCKYMEGVVGIKMLNSATL